MKIAITGCSGSVGPRVTLCALTRGHTVLGLDLAPEYSGSPLNGFTYASLDVRDFSATLDALRGCDAAVHLAAHRNPTDYLVKSHNDNVVMSWNLLRACAELGINRVVLASSVNVIPMVYSLGPRFAYFPIDEAHPTEPDEPYGLSKVIAEIQADAIVRRYPSMRVASLRLHWSLPNKTDALADEAVHRERRARDLWGWVQEDAAADAVLRALTAPEGAWAGHERFFIVAPDTATVNADSGALRKSFYPDVPVREGREVKGTMGFFDCAKAEKLLGWVHPF